MQVQIIFTAHGSSTVTGNFAPGDTLRCDAEQARHFVEDAQCARYADLTVQTPAADPQPNAQTDSQPRPAAKRARRNEGA